MKKPLLVLSLLAALSSCKTNEETAAYLQKEDAAFVLNVEATPCFGECPVYTMQINDKGVSTFNGKRFVDPVGQQVKYLPKWEVDSLKLVLLENNFFELDSIYDSNITDVPAFSVSFEAKGGTNIKHFVIGRAGYPKDFERIKAFIERVRKRNYAQ